MTGKDVNVAFEEIFMGENSCYSAGKEDGEEVGRKENLRQGFQLGISKGCELAQEIGFYKGFLEALGEKVNGGSEKSNKRVASVISSLQKMLGDLCDPSSDIDLRAGELTENIEKIRNKFKQAMSLLKLSVSYGGPNQTTF